MQTFIIFINVKVTFIILIKFAGMLTFSPLHYMYLKLIGMSSAV